MLRTFVDDPPVIVTLLIAPKLVVPLTATLVRVPTLVMLGCAAVVTVPAVVALAAATKFAPPAPLSIRLPTICRLAFSVAGIPVIFTTGTSVVGAILAPMSVSAVIVVPVAIFFLFIGC